jgi:hypothetical protein
MPDLRFPGRFAGPVQLIAAAQALTALWVDLGSQLLLEGAQRLGVYINLDINGSTNARVRLVARHATGGDDHVLPIRTVAAAVVTVEDEFIEFNVDADQLMLLSWDLDGLVQFAVVQVQAGAVGAPAGEILDAWVTTSG